MPGPEESYWTIPLLASITQATSETTSQAADCRYFRRRAAKSSERGEDPPSPEAAVSHLSAAPVSLCFNES